MDEDEQEGTVDRVTKRGMEYTFLVSLSLSWLRPLVHFKLVDAALIRINLSHFPILLLPLPISRRPYTLAGPPSFDHQRRAAF